MTASTYLAKVLPMQKLTVRRLTPSDMDLWFEMRIESLRDNPSAFLASPEIELSQGVEFFRKRIANGNDENIIVGCFAGDEIVGSVGLYRESAPKARHKGTIWGMFVSFLCAWTRFIDSNFFKCSLVLLASSDN